MQWASSCRHHKSLALMLDEWEVNGCNFRKDKRLRCCHRHELMVLLPFWVGLNLYVFPNQELRKLEAPQWLLPPFEGEDLEHARTSWCLSPPRASPWVPTWLVENIWFTVQIPATMIGWKVTIPTLGTLTLKWPSDPSENLGRKSPLQCSILKSQDLSNAILTIIFFLILIFPDGGGGYFTKMCSRKFPPSLSKNCNLQIET